MAKKADSKEGAPKGGTPKSSTTKESARTADPLADKSIDERKDVLAAAARADERAALAARVPAADMPWFDDPARCATELQAKNLGLKSAGMKLPKALVVDPDKKARALQILDDLGRASKKVATMRGAPGATLEQVQAARAARAAVKRQYSNLYGEAADSCQAAETEFAARA